MSSSVFSGTALPSLLSISNSVDAPVRIVSGTAPEAPVKTVRLIAGRVLRSHLEILTAPEATVQIKKGRRKLKKR